MASAKSFALKALRCNIAGQRFSSPISAQFQNGLAKAQPYQHALRPAFVPIRWHSIPASARSKDYNFSQIKEFASSPSKDRLLIGKNPDPNIVPALRTQAHTLKPQTSANHPSMKPVSSRAQSTFQ